MVVGSGGLLGSALTATLGSRGTAVVRMPVIRWSSPEVATDLAVGLDRLTAAAREYDVPWRIAWCAGAGVTGTSDADLDREVATFTAFLADLATRSDAIGPGTVFLASSAGGLYAGCTTDGPYTEHDVPVPISAYGHAKLAAERALLAHASGTGNAARIGRIANLYGPGQNLAKAQGLISHLCRSNITRQPISVYVSLDTIRDYLYVDDCAAMVSDLLDLGRPHGGAAEPAIKVLASQQGVTIAALIAACRQVFKRAPQVVLGTSANARFQVRDLRLRSVVWTEIDSRALMPLPAGIAATAAGIMRSTQLARV